MDDLFLAGICIFQYRLSMVSKRLTKGAKDKFQPPGSWDVKFSPALSYQGGVDPAVLFLYITAAKQIRAT